MSQRPQAIGTQQVLLLLLD